MEFSSLFSIKAQRRHVSLSLPRMVTRPSHDVDFLSQGGVDWEGAYERYAAERIQERAAHQRPPPPVQGKEMLARKFASPSLRTPHDYFDDEDDE